MKKKIDSRDEEEENGRRRIGRIKERIERSREETGRP